MIKQQNLQRTLHEKYLESKSRNPGYSIRAFSKKVGVTPGTLSLVMLVKRNISKKLAIKIIENLSLDPQERSEIINEQKQALKKEKPTYIKMQVDHFNLIGEWHNFAILNLIKTKSFKSDKEWIAKKLGLTLAKVKKSLELLKRLEMISIDKQGNIKRTVTKYRTSDDLINSAIKKSHHEALDLAHDKLDEVSVENRDYTSITFPFDLNKMQKAKELIRKFQDDFLEIVQTESTDKEVFKMAIQLFPLTKINEEQE